jgi:hypothetical protein
MGGRDGAKARANITLLSNGGTEIEEQKKKAQSPAVEN